MRIAFFDSLRDLARRSSTSPGELRVIAPAREDSIPQRGAAYRLRHWPELPERMRTADVLRVLSLMSSRPVNREWLLRHLRMKPAGVDAFLEKLIEQGDLEVVDTSKYRTRS